jgi:hypothetical protein
MGATAPPLPMARVLQVPGLWYVNVGCQDREHFKKKIRKENLSVSNTDTKMDNRILAQSSLNVFKYFCLFF